MVRSKRGSGAAGQRGGTGTPAVSDHGADRPAAPHYVHPAAFETYQAGTMLEALGSGNGTAAAAAAAALSAEEQAVVRLLSRRG